MVTGLYTILDRLAEETGNVFQAPTVAVAHRQYKNLMTGANVGRPEEYKLLHIGDYDSSKATVEAFAVPVDVTPELVTTEVIK